MRLALKAIQDPQAPLAQQDPWVQLGHKAKQDHRAFKVILVILVLKVPLVQLDPWVQLDHRAILDLKATQDLKAPQAQLVHKAQLV